MEDLTSRKTTIRLISERQIIVADTRTAIMDAFRSLWMESWIWVQATNQTSLNTPINQQSQLDHLLSAFNLTPFSVGASSDVFLQNTPPKPSQLLQLNQWQYDIERNTRHWLQTLVKDGKLDDLFEAHRVFLSLLWNGSIFSLHNVKLSMFQGEERPVIDELTESISSMRDGARDALLRASSRVWSIVFVGAEDSGKSTYINALVGADLLPVTDGPTTAYPCQLLHSAGRKEPMLEFGTGYLNTCLDELRRGDWVSKIGALVEGTWDTTVNLPEECDFSVLQTAWTEDLPTELFQTLCGFVNDDYRFSSPVHGAVNIKATLQDINDLVRICQNLPFGFNRLEPGDWPLITTEFAQMKDTPLPEGLMLIDIPGIVRTREFDWDESTREIIRSAAIVVAVISLPSFPVSSWRQLPRIIRRRTGVDAGAVLLTRMDEVSREVIDDLGWYKKLVRSVFWPAFPEAEDTSHPIIECSAFTGPAADALQAALEVLDPDGPVPDWQFFIQKTYIGATKWMYGGTGNLAKRVFQREDMEDVMDRLKTCVESLSFKKASNPFKSFITRVRQQSALDYYGSLDVLVRSVSFSLRTLMVLIGVAPGSGFIPGSDSQDDSIREQMELLDAWNMQVHAFQEEVHKTIIQARDTLSTDMEICINKAFISATQKLEFTYQSSPSLDIQNQNLKVVRFEDMHDIEQYMDRYWTVFNDLARALDIAATESVLNEANKAHANLFGDLEDKLAIPRMASRADANAVAPRNKGSSREGLSQHVEELRSRYTVSRAFSEVELRMFKTLNQKDDFQERIRHLGQVSRALLAVASLIPFILSLPYWLQKSYVQAYTLNLLSLRPALLHEAVSQSSTLLNRLEGQITADTLRQTQSIIQSKFPSASHRGTVSASLSECQHLIAASANVVGLCVVAETMHKNLL